MHGTIVISNLSGSSTTMIATQELALQFLNCAQLSKLSRKEKFAPFHLFCVLKSIIVCDISTSGYIKKMMYRFSQISAAIFGEFAMR